MDNALLWFIVLVISLFVLVKSADYFNISAENIGLSLGFSPFIIGVLIVAIGTSLPELISSIISVVKESSEIVPGNVLGSNITNIFLIIGITAMVYARPITLGSEAISVDLQFLIGSALFLAITLFDGVFNVYEGILSMIAFVTYVAYQVRDTKKSTAQENALEDSPVTKASAKDYLIFLLSSAFIYVAANYTVEAVIQLSNYIGIGKDIVAASMVAVGTSLPELIVSLNAAKRNNTDVAIGNILGSCVFNAFWVMGVSSLFGPITVTESAIQISLPFSIIAALAFFIMTRDRNFSKWQGLLFLLFYILFLAKLFSLF